MTVELPVRDKDPQMQRDSSTTTRLDRIKVKNRRKRYLDLHPEYFGPQLELAGVQLLTRPLTSRC